MNKIDEDTFNVYYRLHVLVYVAFKIAKNFSAQIR